MPVRQLPHNPSLEHLRHQAKALRRAVRAGDPEALAQVQEHHPRLSGGPVNEVDAASFRLADAQLVTARQYGFPSWPRLRQHLDTIQRYSRSPHRTMESAPPESLAAQADEFLRLACLTYGGDSPARREQARALLAAHPEIATASIHTMAALGEVAVAASLLARDSSLANRQGGPHQWEPLLYLAYSRVESGASTGAGERPALVMARLLLAHGADPNAGYLWEGLTSPFTALTGALGEGEDGANQPPHLDGLNLARLLLAAGADPNDSQALYNRQFRAGTEHLELLLSYGLGRGDGGPWHARLGASHPTPSEMVQDQLLWAARTNQPERVRLLLTHGAAVDGKGTGHPAFGGHTAYELAILNGNAEIAALLHDAGANPGALDPVQVFLGACLRGDRAEVASILDAEPSLLQAARTHEPHLMVRAVEIGRAAALRLLVELGFDVNAMQRASALHEAAWRGNLELVQVLLDLGADLTLRDHAFNATPEDWARHNQQHEVAAYLAERLAARGQPDDSDGS
ncbi:MAG: ankyrin repeat domain-containing protein [Chloroflexota bacterium]